MDKNTLILFDLGNILVKTDFSAFYRGMSALSDGMSVDEFRQSYEAKKVEAARLSGSISTEQYLDELRKMINRKVSDEQLKLVFSRVINSEIKETVSLKKRLFQSGYAVGIFSNCSSLSTEQIPKRFPEVFEVYNRSFPVICSFRAGAVKPEAPMYDEAQKWASGHNMKKVILIEDNAAYLVPGVERYGWFGIHFTKYMDQNEAIRAYQKINEVPVKNFIRAETFEELLDALRKFGVEVQAY